MADDHETEDATKRAIAAALTRLTTGVVSPRQGLREMVAAYLAGSHSKIGQKYVGSRYGIDQLYGYAFGYDDLEERPSEVSFEGLFGAEAVRALDAEVMRLATAWLSSLSKRDDG
jgi:hypothetical protein